MRSSLVRPLLILGPIFAGCSYDFGGSPDGDGGAAATSTVTGFTNAQVTGSNVTQASNATTTTTNATDSTTASSGLDASSSTGMVEVPLPRCTGFSDSFDDDEGFWQPVLAYFIVDNGLLRVWPGDTNDQAPFDLGGRLSQSTHAFVECTLSIRGLQIVEAGAKPALGVFEFSGAFLGVAWDGTNAQRRYREGPGGAAGQGNAKPVGQIDRLTMHFTGNVVRLFADQTLVEEIPRPAWLDGAEFVFVGAIDGGQATLEEFNPELVPSDVPTL